MSDLKALSPQLQTMLQIKLDGYIEACVLAARQQNIGFRETMQITMPALIRELAAHGHDPAQARRLVVESLDAVCPMADASASPILV